MMGDTERVNPDEGKERKGIHPDAEGRGDVRGREPIQHSLRDHPHLHGEEERGHPQLKYWTPSLNEWAYVCHLASRKSGWWTDLATGLPKERNVGEMFMLMVSELAEGFEGVRKDLMDDHLPNRKSVEVELADVLIRVFDFAGRHGIDLDGAVREKMAYNAERADHKPENRVKEGGKQF